MCHLSRYVPDHVHVNQRKYRFNKSSYKIKNFKSLLKIFRKYFLFFRYKRVTVLRGFWDLKKTALREIRVNGTVGGPLLTQKKNHPHLHVHTWKIAVVKTV